MNVGIVPTKEGYVVQYYDGEEWRPLRCFRGQGDAREYAFEDVRKLSMVEIVMTAKMYKPTVKYIRQGFKRYRVVRDKSI